MVGDRISALPDTLLCHILSFLPTKEVVATSVLSKRWNPLWRSVTTLDFADFFYDHNKESYSRFVQSVYAVILSRDMDQPIQRFRLCCFRTLCFCDPYNVNIWLNAVLQRRVEHLDLSLHSSFGLPSAVFSCKTLVVLRLSHLFVKAFPSFDLPSLKILHLHDVTFIEHSDFVELLSANPNLVDLQASSIVFDSHITEGKFRRLHKLVCASIDKFYVPLEVVNDVEFLCIYWVTNDQGQDLNPYYKELIPDFYNLTHLEVEDASLTDTKDWLEVLELLKHCPKLHNLAIQKNILELSVEDDEEPDWSDPPSIPVCISSHLKTCSLICYEGSKGELGFATYIMQNALHLQTMTICSASSDDDNQEKKLEMIQKINLCAEGVLRLVDFDLNSSDLISCE